MKSRAKFIFLFLSLIVLNAFGKGEWNPNSTKFLLLDNRIIEKTENVKLEVGKVEKHNANPLFGEENEWEMRFDNLYGNVIFDKEENIYKCWYCPFIVEFVAHGMTLEERTKPYKEHPKREMGICYATSKDGINWEKPDLGLVEYNGSTNNNIVWRGPHGAGVFKDMHEEDPAKRYKVIFQGMAVAFSADGIHWSKKEKVKGVKVAGDTHNNALWAPTLNKYVGITRTWGRKFGREVARIESDDFINWTREQVVLHGTNKDLQTYAMPTFYYGGVYLGLVAILQPSTDRVWTELTWSPDTRNWFRIDEGKPLIPTSEKELDYDYGCLYACASPVFKDDKIMLYYGGSDWLHSGWRNGFLCLATLRPDGFAGYVQENRNQEGVIVTKSISYKGGALKLTADVEKGGSIIVTVLHSDGGQIATSTSITKTITDEVLQLDNKIREENISLKIQIEKAKVYSFSIE
ncbi:hypothetical protein ES705_10805 [subsurface metagenome]